MPGAEYDLHHFIAYDPTPIDVHALNTDNTYLTAHSRENVQLLFNRIFSLPESKELTHAVLLQRGESGRVVDLPDPITRFPRHKPIPKPKPLTKWEQFAKERGLQKKKRSRMVYDEYSESYKPRTGYGRAVKDGSDQWVIEAKPGDGMYLRSLH
jgi:regulator of ribosome biosynthesis